MNRRLSHLIGGWRSGLPRPVLVLQAGRFLDHDLHDELNQLNLNTRAVLVLAHHFGRRRRGGMIFLASTVAFAGVPGMSAYSASKAHVLTFAEGFAREVADDGIAVFASR